MTANSSMSQQIKEILATYLKRDPDTILPEHNLRDDVGLDSLMTFELLYDLEKTFDLEIPNEDLPGLQTIDDVVRYLEARISVEDLQKARDSSSLNFSDHAVSDLAKPTLPATPPTADKVGKPPMSSKQSIRPKAKVKPSASKPQPPTTQKGGQAKPTTRNKIKKK